MRLEPQKGMWLKFVQDHITFVLMKYAKGDIFYLTVMAMVFLTMFAVTISDNCGSSQVLMGAKKWEATRPQDANITWA